MQEVLLFILSVCNVKENSYTSHKHIESTAKHATLHNLTNPESSVNRGRPSSNNLTWSMRLRWTWMWAYLLLCFLWCCLLSFHLQVVESSTGVGDHISKQENRQLINFFKDTYIQKVDGDKEKTFCYKEGWHLYHFHNVCTRGGQDGIVTGILNTDNDWNYRKDEKDGGNIFSDQDWNDLVIGPTHNMKVRHPTLSMKLDWKEIKSIKYIDEPSLYQNCFEQRLDSYNPAHWLMKLGAMFEMGSCALESKRSGAIGPNGQIFSPPWPLPLKNFYMHQCADPDSTNWAWGQNVYRIVEKVLVSSGILRKNYKIIHDQGYERIVKTENNPVVEPYEITCFTDFYMSQRNGVWMNKLDVLIPFRQYSANLIGEPKEAAESVPETDTDNPNTIPTLPAYCPKDSKAFMRRRSSKSFNPSEKTNAVIKIFKRTATSMLRSFLNMDELVELVQRFTNVPVEIITVNSSTSVKEQIVLFNSFDVLITPHGSHLANGIFTMNPGHKAVIEIASFAFDRVFYSNYLSHLGFGQYLLSTGHLTPPQNRTHGVHCIFQKPRVFKEVECRKVLHHYPGKVEQSFLECPVMYHTRMCDTKVDLNIIESQLFDLFGEALCPPDRKDAPRVATLSTHSQLSERIGKKSNSFTTPDDVPPEPRPAVGFLF